MGYRVMGTEHRIAVFCCMMYFYRVELKTAFGQHSIGLQ